MIHGGTISQVSLVDVHIRLLIFVILAAISVSKAHAARKNQDARFFGEYRYQPIMPQGCDSSPRTADWEPYRMRCLPDVLPVRIFQPNNSLLIALQRGQYRHYHPFEVHPPEVFWLDRAGDVNTTNWADELWVYNLESKSRERLLRRKGLDFRVSPNGRSVIVSSGSKLLSVERPSLKEKLLDEEANSYELLGWSSDGSRFWFGAGDVVWQRLGLYENGNLRWFDYTGAIYDEALNLDSGLLVQSNAPWTGEADATQHLWNQNPTAILMVIDVFSGAKVELARNTRKYFSPRWKSSKLLEFEQKEGVRQMQADDIIRRLQTPASKK